MKIAYLAPELPALSATFVYNEIIQLEKIGIQIIPVSVHEPESAAKGYEPELIMKKTSFLYNDSIAAMFLWNVKSFLRYPLRYIKTLIMSIRDSFKSGLFSHIGMGILYRFAAASHLVHIMLTEKCKHLHVHFAHIPTDIAMYASSISGIPFSFTGHANDLFERGWLLKEKVERSKFAVTISEFNRKFLIKHDAPGDKIHIIRCGVDCNSFITRDDTNSNNVIKIGSMGRMVDKKGFDTLIQACDLLNREQINFHLEIAGDGPLKDNLKNLTDALGLRSRISFKGPLHHEDVPEWLVEQDIFCLPCKKDIKGDMDGIPVVLMEAMLIGVPVIASRISGIPELIEHNKSGLLIDQGDSAGLAQAIRLICTNHELRRSLIDGGINKVKSDFHLLRNVEQLADLFREACNE
jgi:colanic acid/amylovoran biosynthesis glycosyltransferase